MVDETELWQFCALTLGAGSWAGAWRSPAQHLPATGYRSATQTCLISLSMA